jgi:hypothetical protein
VQSPHSCSEVVVTDVGGDGVRSLAAVLMRMVSERVRIELPGRFAFDALWSFWASGPPWVAERAAAVSRSWPSPSPGGGARLVPGDAGACVRVRDSPLRCCRRAGRAPASLASGGTG